MIDSTTIVATPVHPNYALLEKIGEGSYGIIYKAKQLSTGQIVAIKILKTSANSDTVYDKKVARFERETRLCSQINHPHIVKLIDKGFTQNREPFAAFEFVDGITLKEYILQHGSLTIQETVALMSQVLEALIYAHKKGIIHRDLKPQNIMIANFSTKAYAKVLDFGIAAFTNNYNTPQSVNITLTQEIIGTPMYSAPEQLRGEPATVKSDIFAWGLIFIECITGCPVFQGDTLASIFQQQLNGGNIPIPSAIAGHPLATILSRVLQKKVMNRIANPQFIYDELNEVNINTLINTPVTSSFAPQNVLETTQVNHLVWNTAQGEKRQVTALCIKLNLLLHKQSLLDLETQDTIQKDQLNLCKDTIIRYGGYIGGQLADTILVYFGYPQTKDTDARRAGRAALELINEVQKRSALLYKQHHIELDIRISIHSGKVISSEHHVPEGIVPNTAINLLAVTPKQSILVSKEAQQLLISYLEFEKATTITLPNLAEPIIVAQLIGERSSEAFSFLRSRSSSQTIIGREKELQTISNFITQKKIPLLLIQGQAGIGKSKLIYEYKKRYANESLNFIECFGNPEYQNNALYPFIRLLKKVFKLQDELNTTVAFNQIETHLKTYNTIDSTLAIPILCSWLSIDFSSDYTLDNLNAQQQKEIIFDILKTVLFTSHHTTTVVLIEDIHWIDSLSIDFLNTLTTIHCIATTRPLSSIPFKEYQLLNLETLSTDNSTQFINHIVANIPLQPNALEYIIKRTDGIPLFIEELTLMLLENKYLTQINNCYHLIDELDEKEIPVTLKELLLAKLDRLEFAKETAQIAAAIGRAFDYTLLVHSSLKDEAIIQNDLEQLINSNIIYKQRKVDENSYIFRHALIRDAAYDSMVVSYQKEVHTRIAHQLEQEYLTHKQQSDILSFHYAQAELFDKASFYGLMATEDSLKKSSYAACLTQANQAILWSKKIPHQLQQIERELRINQNLVQAMIALKGFGHYEVKRANDRSEELSLQLPDSSDWLLQILWNHIQYHLMSADFKKFDQLWKKAIKDANTLQDYSFMAALYGLNGYKNWIAGDFITAEQQALLSIEAYNYISDNQIIKKFGLDFKAYSYVTLANVYAFTGNFDQSNQYLQKTSDTLASLDSALTKAFTLVLRISLGYYKNQPQEIQEIIDETQSFFKDHSLEIFQHLFDLLEGYLTQNRAMALTHQEALLTIGNVPLTYYSLIVAQLDYDLGNYILAVERIKKEIAYALEKQEFFVLPELYRLLAMCYIKTGKSAIANEYFIKAIDDAKDRINLLYLSKILVDCYLHTTDRKLKKQCLQDMTWLSSTLNLQHDQKVLTPMLSILKKSQ
ncbi:TOMM system kinase/cyclase fusion protein [Aquimarina rhabdastrellae]